MAGDTTITIQGNLTSDPELRFLPSGVAVVNLTIASTPRTFDKATDSWKDAETLFLRASAFRDMAENISESLVRGSAVIAVGRLKSRSYDAKDSGEKRTIIELELDAIGPNLRNATVKISKTQRGAGNGGFTATPASQPSTAPADDPWATGPTRLSAVEAPF